MPGGDRAAQQAAGGGRLLRRLRGRAGRGVEHRADLGAEGLQRRPARHAAGLLLGGAGVLGPALRQQPCLLGPFGVVGGGPGPAAGGGAQPGGGLLGAVGAAAELVEFLALPVDLRVQQSLDGAFGLLGGVLESLVGEGVPLAFGECLGVLPVALAGDPGEVVQLGGGGDQRGRAGPQDPLGVAALLGRDGGGRGDLLVQGAQVLALPVEPFEAFGEFGDLALAERGQRPREQRGQQGRVEPFGELRGAQLQQDGDQGVVTLLAEPGEEGGADRAAVVGGRGVHFAAALEGLGECGAGQRLAGAAGEGEPAGAVDPRGGGEEVGSDAAGVDARLEPCAAGEPGREGAAGVDELQPDVADPGLAGGALPHQVPVHGAFGAAEGGQPVRAQAGVEEEGQQHLQRLGLAGAVLAPQQQAALVEGERLVVVAPDVEDAGPGGLPPRHRPGARVRRPGRGRLREVRHGHRVGSSVLGAGVSAAVSATAAR